MINSQFSPWPSFTLEEADAVRKVLMSNKVNYWTGNECREFEKEFAVWSNSKYAIALGNGTQALDGALKALDVGVGNEVIVTSRTYISSVSSIVNAGAIPVFADVDLDTFCVSSISAEEAISQRTKAVMPIHWNSNAGKLDSMQIVSFAVSVIVNDGGESVDGLRVQ